MPFYAYVLQSETTGKFYVGHTEQLQKRVFEHNNGRTDSLRKRGPWALVHSEQYPTRAEASRREREMKRMKSHAWLERLVRSSR